MRKWELRRWPPARLPGAALFVLLIATCACSHDGFDPRAILSIRSYHLDAEQVMLTGKQVQCGVQNELWNPPVLGGNHQAYRLTDKGRSLQFSDDVIADEPGNPAPYAQVRGDFSLRLPAGSSARDDGPYAKIVTGKLAVVIPQACFSAPLPLMGVRDGQFRQDAPPVMRFEQQDDGWHFLTLVH